MSGAGDSAEPPVWVLADDRAGHANQALGVAEALGLPYRRLDLRYNRWAAAAEAVLFTTTAHLTEAARAPLRPPWPRVIIAAGRRTAPVNRWLKARTGTPTIAVQLMRPRRLFGFDLIAAPAHDALPQGTGYLTTLSAPGRIDRAVIDAAAEARPDIGTGLSPPYLTCLLGGDTKRHRFSAQDGARLGRLIDALCQRHGGAALITTSRRTPTAVATALRAELCAPHFFHEADSAAPNPYRALLGYADRVLVTGDSASMVSEACATGKPGYLFVPASGVASKLARLHRCLIEAGYLALLTTPDALPEEPAGDAPLTPAHEIARAIHVLLEKRRVQALTGA